MDKLGLKKGQDITQPLYLDPQVLTRTETYKGITLQEGEIVLLDPHKIIMKDQETQIDLSSERIKELEKQLTEKTTKIQELETKLQQEALTDQEKVFLKNVEELFKMGVVNNLDNLPPI